MPRTPNHPTAAVYLLMACLGLLGGAQNGHAAVAPGAPSAPAKTPGEERDTLEGLSRQIEQAPTARLHLRRGNHHLRQGRNAEAIADYTRALELDDGLDRAYLQRGIALGREGQLKASVADLSTYIERNPDHSFAYTKRGVRYMWMEKPDKAFADHHRALKLNPNNAESADDLGVIYAHRGDHNKAFQYFTHAITVDPTYQKAYHNRALLLYLMEEHRAALADVRRAERLRRDVRETVLLKGEILEALGRNEQARAARERAAHLPRTGWTETYP